MKVLVTFSVSQMELVANDLGAMGSVCVRKDRGERKGVGWEASGVTVCEWRGEVENAGGGRRGKFIVSVE